MVETVFGIDPQQPVSPKDVRDAVEECFLQAHGGVLDETLFGVEQKTVAEVDQEAMNNREIKRLNVRQLLRKMFEDVGGDYDHPTKETLGKAMEQLKGYAENFRDPDIIMQHYRAIKSLWDKLPE